MAVGKKVHSGQRSGIFYDMSTVDFSKGMEFHVNKDKEKPFAERFNLSRFQYIANYQGAGIQGKYQPTTEQVLRYFFLLYFKDSPVHKNTGLSYDEKRNLALIQAGFGYNPDKRTFYQQGHIDNLNGLTKEPYQQIAIDILRYQNNLEFSQLMLNYHSYYENMRRIYKPIDEERDRDSVNATRYKQELLENNEAIMEKITRLEQKVFADHRDTIKNSKVLVNLSDVADVL